MRKTGYIHNKNTTIYGWFLFYSENDKRIVNPGTKKMWHISESTFSELEATDSISWIIPPGAKKEDVQTYYELTPPTVNEEYVSLAKLSSDIGILNYVNGIYCLKRADYQNASTLLRAALENCPYEPNVAKYYLESRTGSAQIAFPYPKMEHIIPPDKGMTASQRFLKDFSSESLSSWAPKMTKPKIFAFLFSLLTTIMIVCYLGPMVF